MGDGDGFRFGIIGYPLEHTLSPLLHERLGELLGLPIRYAPFVVRAETALGDALARLRGLGTLGLNVTLPYKVAVLGHAAVRTPDARACGAANTLLWEGDAWVAHNTDVSGCARALGEGTEGAPRRGLVLGAGGAARAAALALGRMGAATTIVARNPERARVVVEDLRDAVDAAFDVGSWDERVEVAGHMDCIVNATPLGMHPDPTGCPLPTDAALEAGQVVLDMVYRPLETPLLRLAREAGCRVVDGLTMLIHQGIDALEFWLARKVERSDHLVARLRASLEDELSEAARAA